MTRSLHAAWLPLVCLAAWPAAGDAPPQPASGTDERLAEQIVVIGERSQVPGSGAVLDDVELDRFDQIDLNQVLAVVPGVYVREEDGYGLRPNIGIRGAAAERSQKVTIMQDGVPIAPAPYSAPAAYFVPNISRIERLEVLKGPAAIAHGPHTVGGAINLLSRGLPNERFAEADLSLAGNRYHKLAVTYGDALDAGDGGYLLEALRFGSDGFKELDGGGDTGFVRHDLGLKWGRSLPGSLAHRLTARIGYADEVSGETYLGLADADFLAAPKRRYAASRNDRFESEHWSAMSGYSFALGQFDFNAKAYWHRFDRSWDKLDGFIKGPPLPAVPRDARRPGRPRSGPARPGR